MPVLAGSDEDIPAVGDRANLDLMPNPAVIDYAFTSFPRVEFWEWLLLSCDVINHSGKHYKSQSSPNTPLSHFVHFFGGIGVQRPFSFVEKEVFAQCDDCNPEHEIEHSLALKSAL